MYNLDLWKRRKKELHLTLQDISEQTGIGISTIKDIFRGATYAPRIDTVQAIENALGISDLSDEEISQGVINSVSVRLTALEEDMITIFREVGEKFGEEGQKMLITTGENLLKVNK